MAPDRAASAIGPTTAPAADAGRQLLEMAWDSYGHSRFVAPAIAAVVLLMSASSASLWSLLVFGGWAAFAYGLRFVIDTQWRRRGAGWTERQSRQHLYVMHIATSLVWALTPLLIVQVDLITQFVIGVIVCVVAVADTFNSAAEPRVQTVNIAIELVPLIAVSFYLGELTTYLVGALLIIVAVYLVYLTHKNYHRLLQTILLQNERADLIDRLRLALTEAESSNFAKSRFLANMSHELRTPLNGILGFAQMIGHLPPGGDTDQRNREYAALIEKSGRHLLNLINDLLDIAKAESGRMELEADWLSVEPMVRDAVLLIGPMASDKSIDVRIDQSLRRQDVFADGQRLKQAVINLLSNAIKFTAAGGTVTVDWQPEADGQPAALVVRDTGVGMTQNQIRHAIQPFEQVQTGHEWQPQGTGLGLPIVRLIAEAHGGRLHLDSTPGEGTAARIEFGAESVRVSPRLRRRA